MCNSSKLVKLAVMGGALLFGLEASQAQMKTVEVQAPCELKQALRVAISQIPSSRQNATNIRSTHGQMMDGSKSDNVARSGRRAIILQYDLDLSSEFSGSSLANIKDMVQVVIVEPDCSVFKFLGGGGSLKQLDLDYLQ